MRHNWSWSGRLQAVVAALPKWGDKVNLEAFLKRSAEDEKNRLWYG